MSYRDIVQYHLTASDVSICSVLIHRAETSTDNSNCFLCPYLRTYFTSWCKFFSAPFKSVRIFRCRDSWRNISLEITYLSSVCTTYLACNFNRDTRNVIERLQLFSDNRMPDNLRYLLSFYIIGVTRSCGQYRCPCVSLNMWIDLANKSLLSGQIVNLKSSHVRNMEDHNQL